MTYLLVLSVFFMLSGLIIAYWKMLTTESVWFGMLVGGVGVLVALADWSGAC